MQCGHVIVILTLFLLFCVICVSLSAYILLCSSVTFSVLKSFRSFVVSLFLSLAFVIVVCRFVVWSVLMDVQPFWLVAWSSGRALVFGRCAFAVLRSTCS